MKIKMKHILLFFIIFILLLPLGIFLPHYISKQHNFIGIVANHIYVDNATNKIITDANIHTCYSVLTHGGASLAAIGSLMTQRMAITGVQDLEAGDCGVCSAKLYTLFNIKYLHTQRSLDCDA